MTGFTNHKMEITRVLQQLEYAAIYPESRQHFLYKALQHYNAQIHAAGVAVLFFHEQVNPPVSYMYAGTNEKEMHHWLPDQLNFSSEVTWERFKQAPSFLNGTRPCIWPFPNRKEAVGLLVEWTPSQFAGNVSAQSFIFPHLEAVADVMKKEQVYFSDSRILQDQSFIELVQHKDADGLNELLAVTQTMMDSEMVFWGDTNHKYIEITNHAGALSPGFGFQLPIGQGIGGNAASKRDIIQVDDYRNCSYRYEEVTNAVDSEDIRSGFAMPFLDAKANPTGILYASRRKVEPFSLSQNLLLQRMRNAVEPIAYKRPAKKLYAGESLQSFVKKKQKELRTLLLTARKIQEIEVWLEDLVKGHVFIVDEKGIPYHQANKCKVKPTEQPLTINLHQEDMNYQGKIVAWPNINLPMKEWPEAKEDIVNACQIVLERNENQFRVHENQKTSWFKEILLHPNNEQLIYEGIRLGMPVEQGEIWLVEWGENSEKLTQQVRSQLEEVALRLFKSPLVFFENTAVVLLNESKSYYTPGTFRNQLLKILPVSTWVVHGAMYNSLPELKAAVDQSRQKMQRLKATDKGQYIAETDDYRLNSLLEKPALHDNLEKFAYKTLLPILEYDKNNDTQLTQTLALAIILEKPAQTAKILYVHTNTIHYRTRRAKEILQTDLSLPEKDVALQLAAYIYLRKHHPDLLLGYKE